MRIQLAQPDITQKEMDAVMAVMQSGVLSIGPKIEEFESKLAAFIGTKHGIAVNSGTSALHLVVRALGITKGDEVITTPFSFVASANCILFEGAKPVFVDIDAISLEMDLGKIESSITPKTKAILAVDVFGQPMNIAALRSIAKAHGLALIEDACEAIGSEYAGKKAGSLADAAVFAFYPNKQLTTGEGGMIVTNSDELAMACRSMRSQGRGVTGLWLHHERLGYNYRMSEINAAIGVVQMDRLNAFIDKRNTIAQMYQARLEHLEQITLPYVAPQTNKMSWFVYVIRLKRGINRDGVMQTLHEKGIACKPYFTPIHTQPYMVELFGYQEEDFPNTSEAGKSCMALPFYNALTENEINEVATALEEGIQMHQARIDL